MKAIAENAGILDKSKRPQGGQPAPEMPILAKPQPHVEPPCTAERIGTDDGRAAVAKEETAYQLFQNPAAWFTPQQARGDGTDVRGIILPGLFLSCLLAPFA